jgi:hypothetical protein
MKIFTTLFALVGLIFLTSIVNVASAYDVPCGACNIQDNQNGVLLWGLFDTNNNAVFVCNKLSDEQRLGTCVNHMCDFCAVWK